MRQLFVPLVALSSFVLPPAVHADVVRDWNRQALRPVFAVGPPQARMLAMVHVAMHDAINSITGEYETYFDRLPADAGASTVAAGAAAAHDVLATLVPVMAADYDSVLADYVAAIPEPDRSSGLAVGHAAAARMLAARSLDGFAVAATLPYVPGIGAGFWIPTPPANAPALLPGFGLVTPFALASPSQFRPDGPPDLSSDQWAADFNEVKRVGSLNATAADRSPEQSATARFWLGNVIPVIEQLARDVSTTRDLSISEEARLFALLNVAIADAYIAAWDAKYAYNFWRPVTAIRHADADGNPDTAQDSEWLPLAPTPPFPDYVSGHTAFARASVAVLEQVFGREPFEFTLTNPSTALPVSERVRTYGRFREISIEMIEARVLAGIHFRTADRDGDRLGRQVAQFAITHYFRPNHGAQ